MLVIEPLFEGDRKYITIPVVGAIAWALWFISPGTIASVLRHGVLWAVGVAAAGLVLYLLRLWLLDRQDDRLYEAGLNLAFQTISEGEWPPPYADDGSVVEPLLAQYKGAKLRERLIAPAMSGYLTGATQRLVDGLHQRLPDHRPKTRGEVEELYDRYLLCFGEDYRWLPYLRRHIKERFGFDFGQDNMQLELHRRYVRLHARTPG